MNEQVRGGTMKAVQGTPGDQGYGATTKKEPPMAGMGNEYAAGGQQQFGQSNRAAAMAKQ